MPTFKGVPVSVEIAINEPIQLGIELVQDLWWGETRMTKMITDVICPFCGTLCDDVEVVVSDDGKQLLEVYNACVIGTEKFLHSQSKDRVTRPRLHQDDGTWKEISYDDAVEYSAQMLAKAKSPSCSAGAPPTAKRRVSEMRLPK